MSTSLINQLEPKDLPQRVLNGKTPSNKASVDQKQRKKDSFPNLLPNDVVSPSHLPQRAIKFGFMFALALAGISLVMSAAYLYNFLTSTNNGIDELIKHAQGVLSEQALYVAINSKLVTARMSLLSCGVFAGLSLGFCGFGLFLLGVNKEMDVAAGHERYRIHIARVYPGVFILCCATLLIGVCVTHSTPFTYEYSRGSQVKGASDDQLTMPASNLPNVGKDDSL